MNKCNKTKKKKKADLVLLLDDIEQGLQEALAKGEGRREPNAYGISHHLTHHNRHRRAAVPC